MRRIVLFFVLTFFAVFMGAAGYAQKPQSLRVMTYNIHHANPPSREKDSLIDLQAVANAIMAAAPDLVALQELDVNNARAGVTVDEAAELGRLTGMHHYFARAIFYRGGAYGVAVLSRFPILDTMRFELPVPEGVKAETRALAVIKVGVGRGREILFGSTHLDQHRDETTRLLQVEAIAKAVRSFKLPFVIGGDFNADPSSRTIAFMDSLMTRSCVKDCPLTIPVEHPLKTIDYIMYTPAARFTAGAVRAVNETYASDHLPVLVEISLK